MVGIRKRDEGRVDRESQNEGSKELSRGKVYRPT